MTPFSGVHPIARTLVDRLDSVILKQAAQEAVLSLPARERNLLRLYCYDGLTLEQIGRIEGGLNRSTVLRRIEGIGQKLRAAIFALLAEKYGVRPEELDSLTNLRSLLDMSVARILAV